MATNEYAKYIKNPLIIFYRGNEGEWLSFWDEYPDKIYSAVFNNDEVKKTYSTIAFISKKPNEINYIANFRRDKIVATNKVRVLFDVVIKLSTPLTFDFIIQNAVKTMISSLKSIFDTEKTIQYLTDNQLGEIISSLAKTDENYVNNINRILYRDKKLNINNNNSYIVATERDALGLIFRLNDLNYEINNMINWNIEEMSTPDYIKGLTTVNAREDHIIMHDLMCFGDWKMISKYIPSICTLTNGKKFISIMYANRALIENNLGVDLIYYDHINHTYIFVQYKRLAENTRKYVYYPNSDKNLKKEIMLMENLESKLSKDQTDYRLNNQVFYFKFCDERQNIYSKDLSSGFYLPKDYFLLINELQKEEDKHVNISYETVTRYLTNTVFIDLIKYGLIGTKVNDSNLVSNIIRELLSNNKSLILAATSPIRMNDS
jgi:hypothetical protein